MSDFLDRMKTAAKAEKKTIVLPEGEDPRTIEAAKKIVKMGDADGLVSGACHSTANTLRPALQILKTAPGTKLVSAFFIMCTKTPAEELSEIALASAESWKAFMGDIEPKVAMLSFSTMGSAGGEVAK